MSTKATTSRFDKQFDPLKLDAMSEPLTVRVEKIRGAVRTPIPLPAPDDGSPQGTGYSKDLVSGLEQWLVRDWSGGGTYEITVTDDTKPTPQKHGWVIFYNPAEFPEKVPPTLSAAAPPEPRSQPQPQVRPPMSYPSSFPNGLPVNSSPAPQPVAYGPQTYYTPPPQQEPRGYYQQRDNASVVAQLQQQHEADRRALEQKLAEMNAALVRAREAEITAQHKRDMEQAEARARADAAANAEKLSRLESAIEKMILSASAPKPSANDPAIEQLREENRRLAAQADADRREREAERRERDIKDQIARQEEGNRRQMEALQSQIATMIATANAKPSGPSTEMMFMQQMMQQQIEANKEIARTSAAQLDRTQALVLHPRDIIAMQKESASDVGSVTSQIARTYQDIFQMQRQAVETIIQMQPSGGSEVIGLVKEGMEKISGWAERYTGGKTREVVTAQQSQAEIAKAQAQAMQAQAQAMAVQADMQRQAAGHAPQQAASGLGGATHAHGPTNGVRRPAPPVVATGAAAEQWTTGPVPPSANTATIREPQRMGRTDAAWFGPILPQVNELREGVARFLESLRQDPPRLIKKNGEDVVDGVAPDQSVRAVLGAVTYVVNNQIPIPALMDLLGENRVADFVDVLLPAAPQTYRDDVTQGLIKTLQEGQQAQAQAAGNDEDDEDEDEDGEDDDDKVVSINTKTAG